MTKIYPKPSFYTEKEKEFVFSDKVYFTIDKAFTNRGFRTVCQTLWKNFTAGKSELILQERADLGQYAVISKEERFAELKKETAYEYEIDCDENAVHICYSAETGLIHAFCTILQLIGAYRRKTNDFVIKAFTVKDRPAFEMRGMDICLFQGMPLLFIKKCVALCAFLKVSHIVLESWGTMQYDALRELAWQDAFSKSEFKEIIDFGKALGVEFIPFFNHAGHASQARHKSGKHVVLDQTPELEEWFLPGGWTWQVDNEEVIALHKKVRKELCDLYGSGTFFHIGCDEITDEIGLWEGTGISESDGFTRFLNRTNKDIAQNLGRKTMMWGDMFLDQKDFPYPFCANTNEHLIYNPNHLTEDMYIIDWQYNIPEENDESVKYFLQFTDPSKLILAPWQGREKILGRVNLARKYHLYGVMGTTWNAVMFDISDMRYTACCMWEEEPDPDALKLNSALHAKTMTMQFLRKLLPADSYESAGFSKDEMLHIQ